MSNLGTLTPTAVYATPRCGVPNARPNGKSNTIWRPLTHPRVQPHPRPHSPESGMGLLEALVEQLEETQGQLILGDVERKELRLTVEVPHPRPKCKLL